MTTRTQVKTYTRQRAVFLLLKMLVFLMSLTMVTVLLWLRLDWGVTHWAYHAYFSHFWPGVYISLSGPQSSAQAEKNYLHNIL